MTVFKDARALADRTFRMVDGLLLNKTPETDGITTYNNGVKNMPTYICKPLTVTAENYAEILINSGRYEASDFN